MASVAGLDAILFPALWQYFFVSCDAAGDNPYYFTKRKLLPSDPFNKLMKVEKYQLKSESNLTTFEFISEGPKGLIRKKIQFQ